MCLLTFVPANVMPDAESLRNGTYANDDGHGFAIVDPREHRLIIQRGLNGEEIIDAFMEARAVTMDGPALFHSRFTTHGQTDVANCHPFTVGNDPRTVIAHNGVLPRDAHPKKGDDRSDTRIAAEEVLPRFGPLRARQVRLKVERWMTAANKIVVLSVDRRFRDNAYILNEESGTWDGGIWYSNSGYQPSLWSKSYYGSYAWDRDIQEDIKAGLRCDECWCRWHQCECWMPRRERSETHKEQIEQIQTWWQDAEQPGKTQRGFML